MKRILKHLAEHRTCYLLVDMMDGHWFASINREDDGEIEWLSEAADTPADALDHLEEAVDHTEPFKA